MDGRYQQAIDVLEASDSLSTSEHFLMGRAYQALYQHRQAVQHFARADTTTPQVLIAWGQSLRELGQTSAARHRYEHAYQADSTNLRVAAPLAALYADRDRWPEVRTIYRQLLHDDPDNPVLLTRLATAYHAMDSIQAARIYYERALQYNPKNVKGTLRLSSLHLTQDSLAAAQRVIAQILRHYPNHPTLRKRQGVIAFQAQRYPRSIAAFQRTLALGDSSAVTLRKLGIALFMMGQPKPATRRLRSAHQVDSTNATTVFYLGMAEHQLGHYDAAQTALEEATRLMGQSTLADVYEQLADVYKQQHAFEPAIRADRLALQLNPEKDAVLFHLATLYDEYYADPTPALRYYQKFLKCVPEEAFRPMQEYARQRVESIRSEEFFRSKRDPSTADSAR